MIDTNNKRLIYMTRAVLPEMVERNRGHIINIGSTAGSWSLCWWQRLWRKMKAFVRCVVSPEFAHHDLHGTAVRVTLLLNRAWLAVPSFPASVSKGDDEKARKTYEIPPRSRQKTLPKWYGGAHTPRM